MRTTTCLQYLQTSDIDEPARNSIVEPQFGQGPLATAMTESHDKRFSHPAREGSLARVSMKVGTEHLVDAGGCRADALSDLATVRALLDLVVARLELRVVGEPMWHAFPGREGVDGHPGGVTGVYLLTESHLSVHTYPEHGTATINLYCCRARASFPWEAELARALGAARVVVRTVVRGEDA